VGGVYCPDVDAAPILPPDSSSNVGVRDYAIDPVAAGRFWILSEELTGVRIWLAKRANVLFDLWFEGYRIYEIDIQRGRTDGFDLNDRFQAEIE
jgi:hypothetical protein